VQDGEEAKARNSQMVDRLVEVGAARVSRIEEAFRAVLRHWFLPEAPLDEVYRDAAVVTHRGPDGTPVSSSSQPAIMARMLGQLDVQPGHRVLEIGAGTGYNAALLARLVGPEGEVVTVDVDPAICARAERHLRDAGIRNVSVLTADGWTVRAGGGPFDRVEATVGAWDLSTAWVEQLQAAGIVVVPLWLRAGLQASVAFRESEGRLESLNLEPCGFMRLRGPGAGRAAYEQIGNWTVSLDEPSPGRTSLLRDLLKRPLTSCAAPPLSPGWFTVIALTEPDAVHLFSLGSVTTLVACGILDPRGPGLAVITSRADTPTTLESRGEDEAPRRRLLGLIEAGEPAELGDLAIAAVPAAEPADSTPR
jgi:protein-L-isoaspartate(D-aspartate) O-methyltransferase